MKARTVVGRGQEGPLCDPGPELLLGGGARVVRGKYNEKEIKKSSRRQKTRLLRSTLTGLKGIFHNDPRLPGGNIM